MKELAFGLEFRGQATASQNGDVKRRAQTVAPSQRSTVIIGLNGVDARTEDLLGEQAILQSEIERFDDGTFVEEGTISYGPVGKVVFKTTGRGFLAPTSINGWTHGAVLWTVTGGDGWFLNSSGFITSNFKVNVEGNVIDNQYARLFLV